MRDPRYNGIDDSIKDQAYADAVWQERESLTQEKLYKSGGCMSKTENACTHGKTFDEECYDCGKVWEMQMLEISKQHVREHKRNLERLEAMSKGVNEFLEKAGVTP